MNDLTKLFLASAIAGTLALSGCGNESGTPEAESHSDHSDHEGHDHDEDGHEDHDHADGEHDEHDSERDLGSVTIAGTLTGEPAGRLYVSNATEADGTATLNLSGTGLEWTGNYLESGTLVNRGLLRWTTNVNSRGVRGGATLRNEGTLRWEDAGYVFLGGSARFE